MVKNFFGRLFRQEKGASEGGRGNCDGEENGAGEGGRGIPKAVEESCSDGNKNYGNGIKLFVGNCADDANAEDLKSIFCQYGRVMEAEVINGKGFGFVVSLFLIFFE